MDEKKEEDIVKKALGTPPAKAYNRRIPYCGIEHLIEDVEALYPRTNELFIYVPGDGEPELIARNLRGLRMTVSYSGKNVCGFNAKWYICFAAIEQGFAFLKMSQLNIQEV